MHLIKCRIMKLEYFVGEKIPPYAILSHTWEEEEVSMHDFQYDPNVKDKKGYAKIVKTCELALAIKYFRWVDQGGQFSFEAFDIEYAWVDTYCIEKSYSAEPSEAINSMFAWYRDAKVCFVRSPKSPVRRDGRLLNALGHFDQERKDHLCTDP